MSFIKEMRMKRYYFMMLMLSVFSLRAHEESISTEQAITQKIAYLEKKFSHMQELVTIFESIATDIVLLLETKDGVKRDSVYTWLVKNNLIRKKKNSAYDETINETQAKLFVCAFKRLTVPQFTYLRTYIKLHNQLLRGGGASGSICR